MNPDTNWQLLIAIVALAISFVGFAGFGGKILQRISDLFEKHAALAAVVEKHATESTEYREAQIRTEAEARGTNHRLNRLERVTGIGEETPYPNHGR